MELDDNQMCGFIVDMDYREAIIITDDSFIEDVGGIEQGSFLVAESDAGENILLRTIEPTPLIDESSRTQIKNDTFSNELTLESDEDMEVTGIDEIDPYTKSNIQKQGYLCSVLGTFYETNQGLEFGGDVQTVLSGEKYKVYKPKGKTLEKIVNYNIDGSPVTVGNLSYTETKFRDESSNFEVPAKVDLDDFEGEKTAFFGMTRTGKSNSIKVLASALHREQLKSDSKTFGQLIVDASGEYANPNEQDDFALAQLPNCVVYTDRNISGHNYKPIRDDLYKVENQEQMIELMKTYVAGRDSDYINSFKNALDSIVPESNSQELDWSEKTRNNRKQSLLYAILAERELEVIDFTDFEVYHNSVKQPDFEDNSTIDEPFSGPNYSDAVSRDWEQEINDGGFIQFSSPEEQYEFWKDVEAFLKEHDIDLQNDASKTPFSNNTLAMLHFLTTSNSGTLLLSSLKEMHNKYSEESMIEELYPLLREGKLVILDLSSGREEVVKVRTNNAVEKIYNICKNKFRENEELTPINVYLEEAHRYFDEDSYEKNTNPYVRIAKEGAKMNMGLSYATQEVSSIDERVLSNTANWIVTHINNGRELANLTDYYDFESFQTSIRRVDQEGFAKLLTESHRYAVPIRVSLFDTEYVKEGLGFEESVLIQN